MLSLCMLGLYMMWWPTDMSAAAAASGQLRVSTRQNAVQMVGKHAAAVCCCVSCTKMLIIIGVCACLWWRRYLHYRFSP
jgi:hypothetical protein